MPTDHPTTQNQPQPESEIEESPEVNSGSRLESVGKDEEPVLGVEEPVAESVEESKGEGNEEKETVVEGNDSEVQHSFPGSTEVSEDKPQENGAAKPAEEIIPDDDEIEENNQTSEEIEDSTEELIDNNESATAKTDSVEEAVNNAKSITEEINQRSDSPAPFLKENGAVKPIIKEVIIEKERELTEADKEAIFQEKLRENLQLANQAKQAKYEQDLDKIIDFFQAKQDFVTNGDIEKELKISDQNTTEKLNKLIKMGKIIRFGAGPGTKYRLKNKK